MVISDNNTRWNSTYISLTRGLDLYAKIKVFSEIHQDELGEDFLLPNDWEILRQLQKFLCPFWQCTLDLQSQASNGTHGAIWEALPAIEFLLQHLEQLKQSIPASDYRIRECVLNAWSKLRHYYDLTDSSHHIYAAATLLNPDLRIKHFKTNWTGDTEGWIPIMKNKCRLEWETTYLSQLPPDAAAPKKKRQFDFRYWIHGQIEQGQGQSENDEFSRYTAFIPEDREEGLEDEDESHPIRWWSTKRIKFPSLHLYAFDLLSCPAMSTECERVFSGAKRTITPERNRLTERVIEACECLKAWWRQGVVTGATPGAKKRTANEMGEAAEDAPDYLIGNAD